MVTTGLLSDEFWPGDELGDYRLLERIGAGGEGSVWSAWDTKNNQVIAIKFILQEQAQSVSKRPGVETGFFQNLDHPSIRKTYEVGDAGKFIYFSMPFYPSGSLDDFLIDGALSVDQTLRITAQIVDALEYIHARNIIHRDLKPTNILMDAENRAFLTDFGIARTLSDSTLAYHTGHGTFRYSPPEQHTEAAISRGSDIYSLGLMIFEMLTGTLPWGGDVALAIRQLDTGEGIPDPQEVNLNLPPEVGEALRRLTDISPENRPSTASEAFGLVVAALGQRPLDSVTPEAGEALVQKTLSKISIDPDESKIAIKEANKIMQSNQKLWSPEAEKFNLHLTRFAYLDSVFSSDGISENVLDQAGQQFMARGALVHDFNRDYWWKRLEDVPAQLQLCEQVIEHEEEDAIALVLSLMLKEPPRFFLSEHLSPTLISRLFDMAVKTDTPLLQKNAFDFIGQVVGEGEENWRPIGFSKIDDTKLAGLALDVNPNAVLAARLIGKVRSETAVNIIRESMETRNSPASLSALVEVMRVARSLPASLPGHIRRRVWGELTRKQLFSNWLMLLRAFLVAALGAGLGIGYSVFATYRLPAFLDSARILNALGSGLFFGPLIGLGIFLTRLIVHRLRHMSPVPRVGIGVFLGGLVVNLSFHTYHLIFLDATPNGWLISFGSFVMIIGFALGAEVFSSRVFRSLIGVLTTGLGLGLSWVWSMSLFLTPMIYYDSDILVESLIHIFITALMIGVIPHFDDSLNLNDPIPM